MYRKAMLFNDKAIANEIMAAKTPKKQKALGRKVREFDNEICIEHREQIVEDGNWYKFSTGQGKLAKKLLATGTTELIEVRYILLAKRIQITNLRHQHKIAFGASGSV